MIAIRTPDVCTNYGGEIKDLSQKNQGLYRS